jgi:polysaccharide biosynthesis/export protein
VIRMVFQLKSVAVVLVVLLGIAEISPAAQNDRTPSKELVQYIREARRRGVAEAKIKKQAVAVGWPAAAVDEAIVYEKSGTPLPAAPTRQAAVMSQARMLPPASDPARVVDAAAPSAVAPGKTVGAPAEVAITTQGTSDEYLIGSGDTLQISVYKEPEASVPSVVVRPDGKITMPLIKDVAVAGLTPRQVEAAITERLGKFITDPNVTVVVAAINSKKIYLIGGVKKEGTLPYTYGMTVMQALSEAGGLTDYAKRSKIYILRTESGREYRLGFNYDEVVKGEKMEQNVVLLSGDTIVIPR